MKVWKLSPILFAVAAAGFSVPTVNSVITGEPLNVAFLVLALSCFVFAIVFFIVGLQPAAAGDRPAAYRRLVRISVGLGVVTLLGGLWWVLGGAGIYGSPVAGALEDRDRLTGNPNNWEFWMLWVVVAGPIALLPCALLEWRRPRAGAGALVVAAAFAGEAGIRASRTGSEYAWDDALIVIGGIATPMLLLAMALLVLGAGRARRRAVIVASLAVSVFVVGLLFRYTVVKNQWNAHDREREQKAPVRGGPAPVIPPAPDPARIRALRGM